MKNGRRPKGSGALFKKANGRFAIRFTDINGIQKTVTLRGEDGKPITNRTDAEKLAEKMYQERDQLSRMTKKVEYIQQVATVKQLITVSTVKLSDIWETYLHNPNRPDSGETTLEIYKGILKAFLEYCTKQQIQGIAQLTTDFVGRYLLEYWKTNVAPRTYNRHLQALKLIFKTVLKDESPFEEFRAKIVENESHKPFTPEQVNQIFAKVDDPDFYLLHRDEMRILLMLGLAFGLRLHDAACFQWSYIKGGIVEFKPAKIKKHLHESLVLPIPEILQEQFKNAESWRIDQYVLPNVAKRYGFNKSGVSQDVVKILEAAGIQTKECAGTDVRRMKYIDNNGMERIRHISRYSFHSFRHTFCSMAANAGMDLSVVRSIVGHTNISMTEHYTHYSLESKRQVIESLPLPSTNPREPEKASIAAMLADTKPARLERVGHWLEANLTTDQKEQIRMLL